MFRRRVERGLLGTLRGWIWPAGGWPRALRYLAKRTTRLAGTPHSIAAGLAAGIAISCTPFLGFHILLACLICLAVRGNFIAAAIGTVAGNPWTFPLIWVWTYSFGRWLLGDAAPPMTFRELTPALIFDRPTTVLWPMVIGGVPTAIVAGIVAYFPLARMIAAYQHARRGRRERRRAELALRPRRSPLKSSGGRAEADIT